MHLFFSVRVIYFWHSMVVSLNVLYDLLNGIGTYFLFLAFYELISKCLKFYMIFFFL